MEKPIEMDDLGVPLLLETPIYLYSIHILYITPKCTNPSKML